MPILPKSSCTKAHGILRGSRHNAGPIEDRSVEFRQRDHPSNVPNPTPQIHRARDAQGHPRWAAHRRPALPRKPAAARPHRPAVGRRPNFAALDRWKVETFHNHTPRQMISEPTRSAQPRQHSLPCQLFTTLIVSPRARSAAAQPPVDLRSRGPTCPWKPPAAPPRGRRSPSAGGFLGCMVDADATTRPRRRPLWDAEWGGEQVCAARHPKKRKDRPG